MTTNTIPTTVTVTAEEWLNEETTILFNIPKKRPKEKEKIPGLKPVLISDDAMRASKHILAQYKTLRPLPDMPEVLSALIEAAAHNPNILQLITKQIIESRRKTLAQFEAEQREE